ncbi:hypothetical protein [Filomicrobium sp.]|uniref:hypothetical protein n=1 Tax=Filomicrobium sp. TaxID=2024831 RepID=UPI00258A6400|nr:hypothetical protein [Filomicrobium sp.]MCV0371373.1 hypothetical protein [Filomicrobium sp.]
MREDSNVEAVPSDLEERAAALVNPASGIANDFLNHFNEVLLLIENLPEMVDELLGWAPRTYREYFTHSELPGSKLTLEIYDSICDELRTEFEARVDAVNLMCLESIDVIKSRRDGKGEIEAEDVEEYCEQISLKLRSALSDLADLVNNGYAAPVEAPQSMADRMIPAN